MPMRGSRSFVKCGTRTSMKDGKCRCFIILVWQMNSLTNNWSVIQAPFPENILHQRPTEARDMGISCGKRASSERFLSSITIIRKHHRSFLVKSKGHASMKSNFYNVYADLDKGSGEILYAKCNCIASQGGFCKHFAALLYSLLDCTNIGVNVGTLFIYVFLPPVKCSEQTLWPIVGLNSFLEIKCIHLFLSCWFYLPIPLGKPLNERFLFFMLLLKEFGTQQVNPPNPPLLRIVGLGLSTLSEYLEDSPVGKLSRQGCPLLGICHRVWPRYFPSSKNGQGWWFLQQFFNRFIFLQVIGPNVQYIQARVVFFC